ncbi:MAG: hypothetical protein ACRC3B_10840, partial [Bacteroidia bacterium]
MITRTLVNEQTRDVYMLRAKMLKTEIDMFDAKGELIYSKKYGSISIRALDLFQAGGKIYLMTTGDEGDMYSLLPVPLLPSKENTFGKPGAPLFLGRRYNNKSREQEDITIAELQYRIVNSPDRNYTFFLFKNDMDDFSQKQSYKVVLYKGDLEKVWENELKVDFPINQWFLEDIRVDNSGNVFIAGSGTDKDTRSVLLEPGKKSGDFSYSTHLFVCDGKTGNQKDFSISLPGYFVTDLGIALDKQSRLVITAFYAPENSFSIEGVFQQYFDVETEKLSAPVLSRLPAEFLGKNLMNASRKQRFLKPSGSPPDSKWRYKNLVLDDFQYSFSPVYNNNDGSVSIAVRQYAVIPILYAETYRNTDADMQIGIPITIV